MPSRGRELSTGGEAAATLLCTVGQSQHGLFYWCGRSQNVHFPALLGQSPAQPGEVSFSCILLSHESKDDEEMLPHLTGVVGGEVHPDVDREMLGAAEEEIVSACTTPAAAAGVPSYLLFWQISIYASARGLESYGEELKIVKMTTSSLNKVIKSFQPLFLKVFLVSGPLPHGPM